MEEETHRYELNLDTMMFDLLTALAERGYRTVQHVPGELWTFETKWGRGAAYGEIGSTLYGLLATHLQVVDCEATSSPANDTPASV